MTMATSRWAIASTSSPIAMASPGPSATPADIAATPRDTSSPREQEVILANDGTSGGSSNGLLYGIIGALCVVVAGGGFYVFKMDKPVEPPVQAAIPAPAAPAAQPAPAPAP